MMAAEIRRVFLKYARDQVPLIDLKEPFEFPVGVSMLVAPSGAGKTSLFRVVSGWFVNQREPDGVECEVEFGFDPLRDVEFIGNHQGLFPWLRVIENIQQRCPDANVCEIKEICEGVGLATEAVYSWPYELSLGMYKRAELVSALFMARPVTFLDEFFASLDRKARDACLRLLVQRLGHRSVVISTHTPEAFPSIGRRIHLVRDRDERSILALEWAQ